MPILIDELEIELAPGAAPEAGRADAEVMPLPADEHATAAFLDLIAERRARLLVD